MRVLLFLSVSIALLYAVVNGDHNGEHHSHDQDKGHDNKNHDHDHKDHKDDHKDHKDEHHHHPHGKEKHHHDKHHHSNESLSCHKIAPTNADFAFHFFNHVASAHPNQNIFFSPISISTALGMLSLGARAQTHDQIIEGLGFNTSEIPERGIHEGFHNLLHVQDDPDRELQLSSGNALFIRKELKLLQSFLEDAKNFYEAEAFSTDFQISEEAKSEINSYVEKKTNGKIKELMSSVSQDAVMVLINYIFFKGKWEKPFEEEHTSEANFTVDENTVVKVPMMHRTGFYKVAYDRKLGCTVVELPYKGNASAWFILPGEGKLKEVEDSLQKSTVKSWKKLFHESLINLQIPRFSISASLDLKPELIKLGITNVFSDQADLSGITGGQKIKISQAVHKAVLTVDERGTEAAGATAMEAIPMMLPPTIAFNKPFFFVMYDHITKSVPFIGKICNPTA